MCCAQKKPRQKTEKPCFFIKAVNWKKTLLFMTTNVMHPSMFILESNLHQGPVTQPQILNFQLGNCIQPKFCAIHHPWFIYLFFFLVQHQSWIMVSENSSSKLEFKFFQVLWYIQALIDTRLDPPPPVTPHENYFVHINKFWFFKSTENPLIFP
jgi:hypothetical protein